MKLLSAGFIWIGFTSAIDVRKINKRDASNFLLRTTRSNTGLAEELLPNDLERECNEEACRYEEVRETGLAEDQAEQFFDKQTNPCSYYNACETENTVQCINGWGIYFCECKEDWTGDGCELHVSSQRVTNAPTEAAHTHTEINTVYVTTTQAQDDDNIIIPERLEAQELELISEKLDTSDVEEYDDEEVNEKRGLIRQQLNRLDDLYELISMMSESAKEESTKKSLEQIKTQLDKMKAQLEAKLNDHSSSLTFTKSAAQSIQDLLDSLFRQVLPPLPQEPSSQHTQNYSVECGTDFMTVDLHDHFINELQLEDSTVIVQTHDDFFESDCPDFAVNLSTGKISIPISSCLIQKSKNDTFLSYSYEIFVPPKSVSGLVTEYGNHWMATCHYENRKTVSVSKNGYGALTFPDKIGAHGANDTDDLGDIEGVGEFDVEIDAFKTASFIEKYEEYPITAGLGDYLKFQISFTTEEQAKNHFLIAEECWTFPDYNSETKVSLIDDRCVSRGVSSLISILDRPVSNVDRWSSRVFKFPGDNTVFIQCRVLICYDESDCLRTCDADLRARRSVGNGNHESVEKIVTSKALKLKRSVENFDKTDKIESADLKTDSSTHSSLPISLNFLFLVVLVAFIMLAVYTTRDYENETKNSEVAVQGIANTAFDGVDRVENRVQEVCVQN